MVLGAPVDKKEELGASANFKIWPETDSLCFDVSRDRTEPNHSHSIRAFLFLHSCLRPCTFKLLFEYLVKSIVLVFVEYFQCFSKNVSIPGIEHSAEAARLELERARNAAQAQILSAERRLESAERRLAAAEEDATESL